MWGGTYKVVKYMNMRGAPESPLSTGPERLRQKAQNFAWFGPNDFVQISPACGPNTYQIMYGETLDFRCQHQ